MTTFAPPPPAAPVAPAAPPPLTPRGRSTVRVVLVVVAVALTVGVVLGLVVIALGISSVRVSTDGKDLPRDMRSLTIDAADATIRLVTDPKASAPRVDLRMLNSTKGGRQQLQVTSDGEGTRIQVTPASPAFMDWGRTGDVTVTLPPGLSKGLSVTARQDDGTLIVDADLDRLVARTSDGDVVLQGTAHRIDVTAEDGDIRAREPIAVTESFSAETRDGNVAVGFGPGVPRTIDAATRDGDIAIVLPNEGPYLVRTQSGDSTSVRVPETTDPARAASEVTVRSNDGNVMVGTDFRR